MYLLSSPMRNGGTLEFWLTLPCPRMLLNAIMHTLIVLLATDPAEVALPILSRHEPGGISALTQAVVGHHHEDDQVQQEQNHEQDVGATTILNGAVGDIHISAFL